MNLLKMTWKISIYGSDDSLIRIKKVRGSIDYAHKIGRRLVRKWKNYKAYRVVNVVKEKI